MALPGLSVHLFLLSRGSGYMCFVIPCNVSPTLALPGQVSFVLALPGLRFHVFWLSPGSGFIRFWHSPILAWERNLARWVSMLGGETSQTCKVSSIGLALPGLRYHVFWHSLKGFIHVGSPGVQVSFVLPRS